MLATFGYKPFEMLDITIREASVLIENKNIDIKNKMRFNASVHGINSDKIFNDDSLSDNPYKDKFKNEDKLEKMYNKMEKLKGIKEWQKTN